jgi:hypothetical protein
MKTLRTFKDRWFLLAIVATIIVGEVIAWELSARFGLRNNPVLVAILCTGLVAAITAVLYDGADIG